MATILIADDDADIRKLLEVTLRNRGHDVIAVDSGSAVLEAVERVTPDLGILDVNMPGLDGTRVARALRARASTASMPIIFLTALAGEADVLAGFASGADDYVTKPFSPRELGVRVAALLARASSGTGPAARPQGRVIAIAGPKGGTGRTTVAVNLALALLQRDSAQRTLLVEGSLLIGDIAVHLDLRSNRSLLDLLPYAGRLDVAVLESVLVRHRSGLEVLLRPQASEQTERITPALFGEALQVCAAIADTVLVDLKAAYDDERVLAALEAASSVVLVLTPEIGALRNARAFLDLAPRLGLQLSHIQVVLNRVHDRAGLSAKDVASALPVAPIEELPDLGPAGTGLVNLGTPIMESDARSEMARRLRRLATALVDVGTPNTR